MRTEKLGYSAVILLMLSTALSIIIFASPASAGGVTSTPASPINVVSGQTFLLRHELYFDQPGYGGYFAIAIHWDAPSSDENFTLENAPSVYWISGSENGLPVENVTFDQGATLTGWQVTATITSADKNYVDGHFNVDIWLRARSGDGTLHRLDNQQLSYGVGISVIEETPKLVPIDNVTVNVLPLTSGVNVSISPSSQSGANGALLNYTVTVTNTGNVDDTYSLALSDNSGWSPSVFPTSVVVPAFSSENVTMLSVTIPSGAIGGTIDYILVEADGTGDSGDFSCTAKVTIARGVNVSISPTSRSEADNATLTYTVTVSNTGNVSDNYILTNNDNSGWSPSVSKTSIVVAPFSSDNTPTLSVTIPDNAVGGTIDNIIVTATGTGVSGSGSCTGQVTINNGTVQISFSPTYENGPNGAVLTYTVTVSNTRNVSDNYSLAVTDNAGWSPSVSPTSLTVSAGSSGSATLSVTIPSDADAGTIDNITVTATSQTDNMMRDSAMCTAMATKAPAPSGGVSPLVYIGIAVLIVVIIAAVLIIKVT